MVARTLLNITSYVISLSCFLLTLFILHFSCFARALSSSKVYILLEGINCYAFSQNFVQFKDISYRVRVFPCRYHSTNDSYTSLSYYCSYQKDKRAKPRHLQIKLCSFWSIGQKGKELSLFFVLECHPSEH